MKYFKLAAACLVVLLASCGKESVSPDNPRPQEFELHIDFWNPAGNNPQISFDATNSSPEVKIDFSETFAGVAVPPNLTNVIIENVRLIDDNGVNYRIDEINAYEWRDDINDWKIDVEFVMNFDQVQDLAVVLVLDASASLGADFVEIKAFANDFIDKIFEQNSEARIGIVDFSDQIGSFGPTNNQTALVSYIASIEQGPFTTMYEAMHTGVSMLKEISSESKVLVTFTDGTDNNSNPEFTPGSVLDALNSDPGGIGITSFTIGFEGNGGVDKPVLNQLTANGGEAEFPRTIGELRSVFERFSESVSTVYNLTYVRNQQLIPESDPAKLKFVLESTPKLK